MTRLILIVIASGWAISPSAHAQHCGNWNPPYTALDLAFGARAIVIGRLQNAVTRDGVPVKGKSELFIEEQIVPHAALKGRKSIVINGQWDLPKGKVIAFLEMRDVETDANSVGPLDSKGETERYVRGALKLKEKSAFGRAQFSLDFLTSPIEEVANSAHHEVRWAGYKNTRKLAENLDPVPWLKRIEDTKTPAPQVRTYTMLVAHCGKKEHAAVFRKLLDAADRKYVGSDAPLFALVLLDRENGWQTVVDILKDKDSPFLKRYGALQTARLIYDERKDIVAQDKVVAAVATVLDTANMADFVIEDMRKWNRWEYCETILKVPGNKEFDKPIVRKSVLRYALQCPTQQAKDYVKVQRAREPEWVNETQELLELEREFDTQKKKGC